MTKIHLLPPAEINKIAAGEVVERPASIVKELIENALDAGATRIEVQINNGGKDGIHVIDNGCGMSPEDALLACEQHATSKIASIDDLAHTTSYGFRGEALASIAAVSTLQLTTRESTAQLGTQIFWENGVIKKQEDVAYPAGTRISVQNLFDVIPARKKFLKTTETEFYQIQQLMHAYAYAHHTVHIKFLHNDRLVYNVPPTTQKKDRIAQLWDAYSIQHLLTIDETSPTAHAHVHGFVSDHMYGRYNSAQIFVFANNRWIKNQSLVRAIIKGYRHVHQPGKYPAAILFIETDQTLLDINIHPRKEDVRFVHVRALENFTQNAIQTQLETLVRQHLHAPINQQAPISNISTARQASSTAQFYTPSQTQAPNTQPEEKLASTNLNCSEQKKTEITSEYIQQNIKTNTSKSVEAVPVILGQYAHTYIMLEHEHGLVFVDQHAAHERIIYEQLEKNFQHIETIPLLFPHTIHANTHDVNLFEQRQEIFAQHGIIGHTLGPDSICISALSWYAKNSTLSELILSILDHIRQQDVHEVHALHTMIRTRMSCAAAVKAGDLLTQEKMTEIITNLASCTNNLTCPHGRPTTWLLPLQELKKKFKRDYASDNTQNLLFTRLTTD